MQLKYFILGFLTAGAFVPIIDGITSWFLTWTEARKARHTETINQINIRMRKDADDLDEEIPTKKKPMGFDLPTSQDQEEEEDEDEV